MHYVIDFNKWPPNATKTPHHFFFSVCMNHISVKSSMEIRALTPCMVSVYLGFVSDMYCSILM